MKMINNIGVLGLALGLAGAAQASIDAPDLTVRGQVKTPACVVTADNDGVYDYGLMSLDILPTNGHVALTAQTKKWSITCSAETYLMYTITDNREGTQTGVDVHHFGLGSVPGIDGSKIGYYTIGLDNAKVDGVSKAVAIVDYGYGSIGWTDVHYWKSRAGYSWHTGNSRERTWDPSYTSQRGSAFEVDIEVAPHLASRSVVGGGQPLTEQVNLDGSATVTFAFGL